VVERRVGQDGLNGGEEFSIVREGQAAHEDCAGKEFLVGGFGG
jgi:hypothetical protein